MNRGYVNYISAILIQWFLLYSSNFPSHFIGEIITIIKMKNNFVHFNWIDLFF